MTEAEALVKYIETVNLCFEEVGRRILRLEKRVVTLEQAVKQLLEKSL